MCLNLAHRNNGWKIVKIGNAKPGNKEVATNHWLDQLARDKLRMERPEEENCGLAALRNAKLEILKDADIICSTAASSGLADLKEIDFYAFIGEEAAQMSKSMLLIAASKG